MEAQSFRGVRWKKKKATRLTQLKEGDSAINHTPSILRKKKSDLLIKVAYRIKKLR